MIVSRENGGVAPIYLCETHVAQVGVSGIHSRDGLAMPPALIPATAPAEEPTGPALSTAPAAAEVLSETQYLTIVAAPLSSLTSADSSTLSRDEAMENRGPENFEAYGTVLQRVTVSESAEENHVASGGSERVCVSRYGERCTGEATVHCPNCGWCFCDAHGEDEHWHFCPVIT